MADNLTLPATGSVVRTVDTAGVHVQVFRPENTQVLDAAGVLTALAAMVAGVRRDAETSPVSADGDVHPFVFNDGGRLKVSVTPADIPNATGSITANAQTVSMQVKRLSNLSISMVATSLVGHNVSFEASNNSTNGTDGNWYGVQVVRSNANTVETTSGVLTSTPVYMWQVNVSDYGYFRVRATAHTSGTAAYIFNPSAYVSEPIPAVQVSGTQPVSGSLTSAGTTTNTPSTPTVLNTSSAASTNATAVKTSAGTLFGITASNTGAAVAFVKLYNKASAPTVGTDVPVITLPIPAGGVLPNPIGAMGHRFTTGLAMAITNLAADSDTTAVAAAQVKVLTSYI